MEYGSRLPGRSTCTTNNRVFTKWLPLGLALPEVAARLRSADPLVRAFPIRRRQRISNQAWVLERARHSPDGGGRVTTRGLTAVRRQHNRKDRTPAVSFEQKLALMLAD